MQPTGKRDEDWIVGLSFTLVVTWLVLLSTLSLSGTSTAQFSWNTEEVDVGVSVSGRIGLALDEANSPHVAYADSARGVLVYGYLGAEGWEIDPVTGAGYPYGPVSLTLDNSSRPHLTYFDAASGRVRYLYHDGLDWRLMDIDESHYEGYSSISIDPDGTIYVAYVGETGDLRLARREGALWQVETVDRRVVTARFPSLAFDPAGTPQIAYYGNGVLFHSRWIGYTWSRTVVDDQESPQFVNLAVDASGSSKVGYRNSFEREVRFAWWNGTAWIRETVDELGDTGWDVSMALDDGGDPHIAYYNRDKGDLMYAVRRGDQWSTHTVDEVGIVGWWSSIALGSDGAPRIVAYSWSQESIRYTTGSIGLGIRTQLPREVTPYSALLVAEVTSLGGLSNATASFEYRVVGGEWIRLGDVLVQEPGGVAATLSDLSPETSYEARALLFAEGALVYGETVRFDTLAPPALPGLSLAAILALSAGVLGSVVGAALWVRRRNSERLSGPAEQDSLRHRISSPSWNRND